MKTLINRGNLYIVATPIGNFKDITLHAIEILSSVDVIVCEEIREGRKLLKNLGIDSHLLTLNEHNEIETINFLLMKLTQGENIALISDCGTPVFADPGSQLISVLFNEGIKIIPIPGPSSLMAALSVCKFDLKQFLFLGFLPAKTPDRQNVLEKYKKLNVPIILMDTPYRLTRLLEDVTEIFGKECDLFLALDISLPSEALLYGKARNLLEKLRGQKKEFILIIDSKTQVR
jgi:16S rRNA (cytidine1402-2'-O)-methyltransferase